MKKVAIIQARMTSTRLPGKVLKEVLGKPLLAYQIERVKRSKLVDEIVIATTINETDIPIVNLCDKLGIKYYRGSEEDVLSRYYEAAVIAKADIIIRLTSDCPVIDPYVIDQVINYYLISNNNYDYVSNSLVRTFPRGMDTEVFSFEALVNAYYNAKKKYEREHVTPYIYQNTDKFQIANVENKSNESKYRWTVDTEEDFLLIKKIIEEQYKKNRNFTMVDILYTFQFHPKWIDINKHIEQKKLGE